MRCAFADCKKKIKLVHIKCKCDKVFCDKHRLPETHKCTYDYKNEGRKILKKNNPVIINKKIISI